MTPADPRPSDAAPITQEDWLHRYKQVFVDAGVPERVAQEAADAEPFHVLSEGFEDDPEGAADMELSYWTNDEPEQL